MRDLNNLSFPNHHQLLTRELQLLLDASKFKPYQDYLKILSDFVHQIWVSGKKDALPNESSDETEEQDGRKRIIVIAALRATNKSLRAALSTSHNHLPAPDCMLPYYVVNLCLFHN